MFDKGTIKISYGFEGTPPTPIITKTGIFNLSA